MRKIPKSLLKRILNDKYYKKCIRHSEGTCNGRITLEHAFIYAGKQINEIWAIVPVCAFHHCVDQYQDCGDLDKHLNQYYALSRATDKDLEEYPRTNWRQLMIFFESKYGNIK